MSKLHVMTLSKTRKFVLLLLCSGTLLSCRGQISERPPIHPQQNMDFQDRFEAQERNPFFEDGRANRMPVEGTISRGNLNEDTRYHAGVDENGNFIEEIPVPVSSDLLYRGQDRYDIYCSVCHGGAGLGDGPVMTGGYGIFQFSLHQETVRDLTDGAIYSAIYNGVRTMPSYRTQIPVEDRWAIVAYVRALQESQNQTEEEVMEFGFDITSLQEEYETDLAQQEAEAAEADAVPADDPETLARVGSEVFTQVGCNACHTVDGNPSVGPSLLDVFGHEVSFDDGTSATADEEYLRESITDPYEKVVQGYPPQMVPFDYLQDNQIDALIEYIKSLSEN